MRLIMKMYNQFGILEDRRTALLVYVDSLGD